MSQYIGGAIIKTITAHLALLPLSPTLRYTECLQSYCKKAPEKDVTGCSKAKKLRY